MYFNNIEKIKFEGVNSKILLLSSTTMQIEL